jgi:hypothetical protein
MYFWALAHFWVGLCGVVLLSATSM